MRTPDARSRRRRLVVTLAAASTLSAGLVTLSLPAAADAPPTGPDVASYQHPKGACIDWPAVAAGSSDGTTPPRQFAFVKATEGTAYANPYFGSCAGDPARGDWAAIRAAGLARGAYHFARPALPISTAVDQADYFVKKVGALDETGDLPPVLDLEVTGGLKPGDLVTWAQTWLDSVRRATGRVPVLYSYPYFLGTALGGSAAFTRYPLWIADYNGATAPTTPLPGGWSSWTAWQYSSSVPQPGIPGGTVDMSRFNGDAAALAAFADGTQPLQWAVTAPAAPVAVQAAPGSGAATVSWVPGDDGGELPSSYVVTASNGATATVRGTATAATVHGLTNGSSYTFTVHAVNSAGAGAESTPSNAAVPRVPTDVFSAISPATIVYGGATSMSARLVRTDTDEALPGRTLTVYSRPHGTAAWSHVADAKTDGQGTARWSVRPTTTTDVMMRWSAPRGWQSQQTFTRTVTVRPVPTELTSWLSPAKVLYGHSSRMNATIVRTDTHGKISAATVFVYHRNHGTVRWAKPVAVRTDRTGTARWSFVPRVTTDVMMRWNAPRGWTSQQSFVRTVTVQSIPTLLTSHLTRRAVSYGQATTVTASLVRRDTRAPLGTRMLAVYTRQHGVPGAEWSLATTLTTDGHGAARWTFTPDANTDVQVVWTAPRGWQSQRSVPGAVGVRPLVGAQGPAQVSTGGTAVVTGSLTPAAAGVVVERQTLVDGAWRAAETAQTAADGTFRIPWTASSAGDVRQRVYVPFRAPYAAAGSAAFDTRVQ